MGIENILSNNKDDLNNLYANIQKSIGANISTQGTGASADMNALIRAINGNLAGLDFIQNQLNLYNNINQEILLKQQQLLKMENDTLMKQLKELESIQSIVINKDRMIQQTEQNMIEQQQNIYLLITCGVIGLLLMISVFLYGYNVISPTLFRIIVTTIVIIYIIIFLYYYDIFYLKTALSYLNDRKKQRINNTLKNWKSIVDTNIQTAKYGDKSKWIENNCSCPPPGEEQYAKDTNSSETIVSDKPGYYYYDGNAPKQLLVPTPTESNSNPTISWPDYSASGSNYYNSVNKTITSNIIRDDLKKDEYSIFVKDTTYTTNNL